MNKAITSIAFLAVALLAGCGGGGSSSSNDPVAASPAPVAATTSGYFIDSPVQGLTATSGSTTSVTDADGKFSYEDGKAVTFSLGGIQLGSAIGTLIMTPTTLDNDTMNVASDRVTNVLQFLQTIDADGDASNGIVITPDAVKAAKALTVDFSGTPAQFAARSSTQYALSVLTQFSANKTLVPVEQARAHYRTSMASLLSGEYRLSFGNSITASLTVYDGTVAFIGGTLPSGEPVVSATKFDADGTLAIACDSTGQACYKLTVVVTDGSSARGSYVNVLTGAQGNFAAEHIVRTPTTPPSVCLTNPQACS